MGARATPGTAIVFVVGCTLHAPEPGRVSAVVTLSPQVAGAEPAPSPPPAAAEAAPVPAPAPDGAVEPAAAPTPAPELEGDDAAACDRTCEGGDQRGDDLLTPVDRARGLLPTWEPDDLVALAPPYVIAEGSPPNRVRRAAADAFVALSDAAFAATGVRVNIRSGYRSFALQCGVFRAEVARQGCAEATRSSARAGFSEHQLGTTVDVAVGWRRLDGARAIDAWLRDHAHEHGWVLSYPEGAEAITGYKHEPWHFRYLGIEAARALHARAAGGRRLAVAEFLGAG